MNLSTFQIISFLLFTVFLSGILYAPQITDFLIKKEWLGFDKTRSKNEQVAKIKLYSSFGTIVFGILMTNNGRLIVGIIMIAIGVITIRNSVKIYRLISSAGVGDMPWFRGDNGVKVAGIFMVIFGAWWMSGLTQTLLLNFFRGGGLI